MGSGRTTCPYASTSLFINLVQSEWFNNLDGSIQWFYFDSGFVQQIFCDILQSHIGWGGERNTLYKSVETFP